MRLMSGFISSPPAPRIRFRLSRSVGSFHITAVPVSGFLSFLSFLSLSWAGVANESTSIRSSKGMERYPDLVRNIFNGLLRVSFWYKLVGREIIRQKKSHPQMHRSVDGFGPSFRFYGLGGVAPCGVIHNSTNSSFLAGPTRVTMRLLSRLREFTRYSTIRFA